MAGVKGLTRIEMPFPGRQRHMVFEGPERGSLKREKANLDFFFKGILWMEEGNK